MAGIRYPQLCALARAAEVLGERWTLLIVRELLLGPRRFSDLRARLDGISPSVLAARLAGLQSSGLVARRRLDRPGAAAVYELTELGGALRPAVVALLRWGAHLLLPARPRERVEADWLRLALAAWARSDPTPPRSFLLRMRVARMEIVLHVAGGPAGTAVSDPIEPVDATFAGEPSTILGLTSGALSPEAALREGHITLEGDPGALDALPALFQVIPLPPRSRASSRRRGRSSGRSRG